MKDFKKYTKGHLNISSSKLEGYIKYLEKKSSMTPYIIEEKKLNGTVLDVFSRLMLDRIIFLGTEIDSDVANMINAQLLYFEAMDSKEEITMNINTPGGSVHDGLSIYDTMQLITPKVKTVNMGLAASMGSIILSGGAKGKRSALKHARTMIHQPWYGSSEGQASDLEITSREMSKLKRELYEIIAKHSGQTYEKVLIDGDRDYWMTSVEAVKYGIIDKVLIKHK